MIAPDPTSKSKTIERQQNRHAHQVPTVATLSAVEAGRDRTGVLSGPVSIAAATTGPGIPIRCTRRCP